MDILPLSHNDTAQADDAFNQQAFIKQVCELIKDCQPPKGIGINGYWGTGKTSTLMQIHKELTGISPYEDANAITNNEDIIPIWFEAWRYQSETVPIVALLQEIRGQIGNWQKFIEETKKLGSISLLGIFGAIDAALKVASGGVLSPNIGKIPELGRQWETDHRETPLPSQDLRKLLEQAINQALNKKDNEPAKRLVIFIDDLDRCLPKVALQLLEGIKVYLNLNNCVLVFGMDQRQIEEALSKALETKDTHQAREYLEKICQDIHHLPIPTQQVKADYLLALLKELDVGGQSANHHLAIKNVLYAYDCLPANPRKIKALSNRLALQLRKGCIKGSNVPLITPETPDTPDRRYMLLVAMAIIYNFHRQLNEQLEKKPEYFIHVIAYAKNPPDPSTPTSIYEPMRGIVPCYDAQQELPTNPSDSNVFRLHSLLRELAPGATPDPLIVRALIDELTCFLDSHS